MEQNKGAANVLDSTCGLFIVGTDTHVGKTYVAAMIARWLRNAGHRVGVYKPAASGCRFEKNQWRSVDVETLWLAAGQPGSQDRVCPQCFGAPIAPHLAAAEEGRALDSELLRTGLEYWRERSDIVVVEGAGGLFSPLGRDEYVADLAVEFHFPLIVVAANRLGVINHTLQTLIAAASYGAGLAIAGVVLNDVTADDGTDRSRATNRQELQLRCVPPVLSHVPWQAQDFEPEVDWWKLAREGAKSAREDE